MKATASKSMDTKPARPAVLAVCPGENKCDNVTVSPDKAESIEWDKIPRLPLSDILLSLACPALRRVWEKRTRILSDARLKNLLSRWKEFGEPNPQELLQQIWPEYPQDNDAVGLVLLCSYFEWTIQNNKIQPK